MTNQQLATKIITTLGKHLAPGECTWGDEHPDAHGDLFGHEHHKNPSLYVEDMILDVEKLIGRHKSKLVVTREV
jgi:hypothetical protein